ncbi:hypothetical protein F4778DRAFT_782846 [Xylariomycetidae sp. FL2044]|nr:hypothetical protein F4778DRAFT_782846 [Xylariomycetidae sp. FL2044]
MTSGSASVMLLLVWFVTGVIAHDADLARHGHDDPQEHPVTMVVLEAQAPRIDRRGRQANMREKPKAVMSSWLITPPPALPTLTTGDAPQLRIRQEPVQGIPGGAGGGPQDPSVSVSTSVLSSVSSSVSTAVSNSVSSVASNSAQSALDNASAAFSTESSAAIRSASDAGFGSGSSVASSSAAVVISSANSVASSLRSVLASVSTVSVISEISASAASSASSAIEAAQASASSSAESAIAAAQASASAAVANNESGGSGLPAGQVGGIVVAAILASASVSALVTFLLIRRHRRKAKTAAIESDAKPASPAKRFSRRFNLFRNDIPYPNYTATVTAGRPKGGGFPTDVKPRMMPSPPPPAAVQQQQQQRPQNPYSSPLSPGNRPFSFTATPAALVDERSLTHPDPGPVSPMTKEDDRGGPGGTGRYGPSPEAGPSTTDYGPVFYPPETTRTPALSSTGSDRPPLKFSLARRQSAGGNQRVQVVRVDSQKGSLHRALSGDSMKKKKKIVDTASFDDAHYGTTAITGDGGDEEEDAGVMMSRGRDRAKTISTTTASSSALPTPPLPLHPPPRITTTTFRIPINRNTTDRAPLAMNPITPRQLVPRPYQGPPQEQQQQQQQQLLHPRPRPETETDYSSLGEAEEEEEGEQGRGNFPSLSAFSLTPIPTHTPTTLLPPQPQPPQASSPPLLLLRSPISPLETSSYSGPPPYQQPPSRFSPSPTPSSELSPSPSPSPLLPPPLPSPSVPQLQSPIPQRPIAAATVMSALSLSPSDDNTTTATTARTPSRVPVGLSLFPRLGRGKGGGGGR